MSGVDDAGAAAVAGAASVVGAGAASVAGAAPLSYVAVSSLMVLLWLILHALGIVVITK
jgi:hypothetical protein